MKTEQLITRIKEIQKTTKDKHTEMAVDMVYNLLNTNDSVFGWGQQHSILNWLYHFYHNQLDAEMLEQLIDDIKKEK